MKTAIKITALAVVTVLVVLSCAPELTLTEPDWATRNEQYKAEYTNSGRFTSMNVTITAPSLTYSTSAVSDQQKEIYLSFPTDADVLKASDIGAELKTFLTFHTYSNPTTGTGYVASIIADEATGLPYSYIENRTWTVMVPEYVQTGSHIEYDWTEIKMDLDGDDNPDINGWANTPGTVLNGTLTTDGTTSCTYTVLAADLDNPHSVPDYGWVSMPRITTVLVVRLNSVPKQPEIIAKVKASAYKRNGQVVDTNGDYVGGEEYDDYYTTLTIGESGESITGGQGFKPPYVTINVNFVNNPLSAVNFTPGTSSYPNLATVSTAGGVSGVSAAQYRKILEGISSKVKIEKYSSTGWTDPASASVYNTESPPSGVPAKVTVIYAEFKPDNLTMYRVRAADLEPVSKSAEDIGKGKAVVIIGDGLEKTYLSSPIRANKAATKIQTAFPFDNSVTSKLLITSDAEKKNVVIKAYLKDTGTTFDSPAYPTSVSTAEFKLVYKKSGGTPSLTDSDLVEIKINSAVITKDTLYSANPAGNNLLTITLDPAYQLNGSREVRAFINKNGLKYGNDDFVFCGSGFYNGTYLWGVYDLDNLKL